MSKTIIGIDCNSKYLAIATFIVRDIAEKDQWKALHGLHVIPDQYDKKADSWERLQAIGNGLNAWLDDRHIDTAYIEEVPYVQNPNSMRVLVSVAAVTRWILNEHKIVTHEINNTTWKRIIIGKGNANKDAIKEWAISELKLPDNLIQDLYDASVIGLAGVHALWYN